MITRQKTRRRIPANEILMGDTRDNWRAVEDAMVLFDRPEVRVLVEFSNGGRDYRYFGVVEMVTVLR